MRDGRNCVQTSGWDGNKWVDGGTGNSREGGGQCDGKQSRREQDALRRDGRRREQTNDGKGREIAVGNEKSRVFPFPSRPRFAVPTITARIPVTFLSSKDFWTT